jgi:hypothetical protein
VAEGSPVGSSGGRTLGAAEGDGSSPEAMRLDASGLDSGYGWHGERERSTGNRPMGFRDGQIGRSGRAAAADSSGAPVSPRGSEKARPREKRGG